MKELLDLGLTKLEASVYLALQELGEAKTGVICKKLNIPNSHIYPALNNLLEKGLISFKYANKIKIFKSTDPQVLQLLFEKKQEELKQQKTNLFTLIEKLKKLPKNKETNLDYQYFEGLRGVKGMILEAYTTAPKNSEMLLISAVSQSWEAFNAFFLEMHKIRVEKNINLKMIMQKKTNKLEKHINERKKIGLIEIHISDFLNYGEILLTEDYLFILDTSTQTKTPCGFRIKNEVFLFLFKEIFSFLWINTKKT